MDWFSQNWQTILTLVLFILTGLFGIYWKRAKNKLKAFRGFIVRLDDALADDTITDKELAGIVRAFKDVIQA